MIKTKCVREPASPDDGLRVLVTNGWPRGVARHHVDVWWPQLGPSAELLADWRRGIITWEEYEERYEAEMCSLPARILREGISREDGRVVITLLCVEKEDDPHCHRHILKAMIEGG